MVGRALFVSILMATLLAGAGCNTILGIGAHTLAPATNDGSTMDGDASVDQNDGSGGEADAGGDAGVDSCSVGGWCSSFTPTQAPNALRGMWESGPNDVWAVGDAGTIVHWNGSVWSTMPGVATQSLLAVWGSGPNDVWAVGHDPLSSVSVTLRWDGAVWASIPVPSGSLEPLHGVWGSGPKDLWAVGQGGTILRWDGKTWSAITNQTDPTLPELSNVLLTGVWGSGPADVWIVGSGGTIVHWDGTIWSDFTQKVGVTQVLNHVWGSGPNDAWAVGDAGTILHWKDHAWSRVASGVLQDLNGMWGTGSTVDSVSGSTRPGDVWVAGSGGTILHSTDGTDFSNAMQRITTQDLHGVWGGSGDVWAVGDADTRVRWDGTQWSDGATYSTEVLNAVWGSEQNDVWAVGTGGAIIHWDGTAWFTVAPYVGPGFTDVPLNSVWGSGANDVWAVGNGGTVLHWNGTTWCVAGKPGCDIPPTGITFNLRGVWASATIPHDVWAVGNGDIDPVTGMGNLILRRNGMGWSPFPSPSPLNGVWGSGPKDVWAVGDSGTILHWNGTSWCMPGLAGCEDVSGSGITEVLRAVGGSHRNVWAVGDRGTILRFDDVGMVWCADPKTSPFDRQLLGVWATSASEAWAVGDTNGIILHLTAPAVGAPAGVWSPVVSGKDNILTGVWGSVQGDVWVVGEGGLILHH
jgi:photosystem II stability/assembly factor-like uncharacterized protein